MVTNVTHPDHTHLLFFISLKRPFAASKYVMVAPRIGLLARFFFLNKVTPDRGFAVFTHMREFYLTYPIPTYGKDKKMQTYVRMGLRNLSLGITVCHHSANADSQD